MEPDLTLDLAVTLDTAGVPDPDTVADTVALWCDRHALTPDRPPVVFVLTDHWHTATQRQTVHPTLTAAKLTARAALAHRNRAARVGDDWRVGVDDHRPFHRWDARWGGAPVALFTIHEHTL